MLDAGHFSTVDVPIAAIVFTPLVQSAHAVGIDSINAIFI